ncbi:carbohydrate ABC transporter permease [Paenibacillus contaminans]|uniref:Carbohydrate ABC transporter permease n=1 Tax=Paenibacillus contaminans TaxID=450362 RepID=A0A329MT32_9BACL|nr:carbohydrate ABC transporter permease [Paenibacillus contaminans]RAV23105.1 carbohydrate ABC transporter permease [Paenibacillus contaminans]
MTDRYRKVKDQTKLLLIGQRLNDGLLFKTGLYVILIAITVLYVTPLFHMISTSVKDVYDLFNPAVKWIPHSLKFDNYRTAFEGLNYLHTLRNSLLIAALTAVIQMFFCALTGYAFARLYLPGKNILFMIVVLTFVIPPETITIPTIMLFAKLGWLNTPLPIFIPAMFSQGLKGALFVIICRQFFNTLPKELEESAKIDGAGLIRTYFKIMLPLARPALIIVFLFSFVWNWNNMHQALLYLNNPEWQVLPLQFTQLQHFLDYQNAARGQLDMNEPVKMAATLLIVGPPLLLYMFLQRYFVEGVERTGMVE